MGSAMIRLGWRDAWANRAAWIVLTAVLGIGLALLTDAIIAATANGTRGRSAATQGAEYVTVMTAGVVVAVMIHLQALLVQDRRDLYRLWAQAGASRARTCVTIAAQGVGSVLVAVPFGAVLATVTAPAFARSLGIHVGADAVVSATWRALAMATCFIVTGVGAGSIATVLSATREVGGAGRSPTVRWRHIEVLVARIGAGVILTPLAGVAVAALVTTVGTGGHSPMFAEDHNAAAGGSVLPTLALTMLLGLLIILAASLTTRRLVPGLITTVGARCASRRPWLMLGWRAGAEDAATSMGASGPVLLGCGFVGVTLGFVDTANAYARSTGIPGGLERSEALVLLVPAVAIALLGHVATLVVLARRRARTARLLRAAGARNGELAASAVVAGTVVALAALAVGSFLVLIVDGIFTVTVASAGADLDLSILHSGRELLAVTGAALMCSILGGLAGVWAMECADGVSFDMDE